LNPARIASSAFKILDASVTKIIPYSFLLLPSYIEFGYNR